MQSMTHLAPAVSLLFSLPFIAVYAGIATPFAFFVAFVIALMLGVALTRLARSFPSAGGYYGYVDQIFGRRAGFLTGWSYVLYSPVLPASLLAFLGWVIQSALRAEYDVNLPWWVFLLGASALAAVAGYRGVRLSIVVAVLSGFLEIGIIVALAAWCVERPGAGGDALSPFSPASAPSAHGLFFAIVFSLAAYSGWEAAAPLAEETVQPARTVPRAVVISLLVMGVFMILCSWALLVGWGTNRFSGFVSARELPAFALAHRYWGGAWILVLLALANSAVGVAVACNNVASRMWFAMARGGSAPPLLARVHPRHDTPYIAVLAQTTFATSIGLVLGFWLGPRGELLLVGLVTSLSLFLVYAAGNAGVVALFLREGRAGSELLFSFVFPLVSTAALAYAAYKAVRPLPQWPADWAPLIVAVWLVAGIGLAVFQPWKRSIVQPEAT
jgi:amino acid transporter